MQIPNAGADKVKQNFLETGFFLYYTSSGLSISEIQALGNILIDDLSLTFSYLSLAAVHEMNSKACIQLIVLDFLLKEKRASLLFVPNLTDIYQTQQVLG